MKHGSLFSGIGGFDLAAQWMGWHNEFHCEWNPFGQKVLKHYWPDAISYNDITKSDFTIHRGSIDILSGGFPCQPYSSAGKRLGKEDDRHLWPEMLRAIREIRPSWVVGENVRGLTNWNGGVVFDEVQADLESEGYEVTPFLLPACGVGAPHRRDRIWFVAFNSECKSDGRSGTVKSGENGMEMVWHGVDSTRRQQGSNDAEPSDQNGTSSNSTSIRRDDGSNNREERSVQDDLRPSKENKPEREGRVSRIGSAGSTSTDPTRERFGKAGKHLSGPEKRGAGPRGERIDSDTSGSGLRVTARGEQRGISGPHEQFSRSKSGGIHAAPIGWEGFPAQPPVCIGDDGLSDRLDRSAILKATGARSDKGSHYHRWRNESIKAAGNAIVPQVAYQIFKAIQQFHDCKL